MKKIATIAGAAIAVSIAIAIFFSWKLRQVDAGICPRTGERLSDAQLRREVIASLVNNKLDIVRHQDIEYLPNTIRFRVTDKISDEEIAKAVNELRGGRDPFAKGSGFRKTRPMQSGQDAYFLKEPFVLLMYSAHEKNASAGRTASQEIRRVEASEKTVGDYRPGILQRMRGFGNHYYQITSRQFIYDCCLAPDAESSPVRKLVPIVYKEVGDRGGVIAGKDMARVAVVSNCGDILTYKDDGGFSRIKWTKGE